MKKNPQKNPQNNQSKSDKESFLNKLRLPFKKKKSTELKFNEALKEVPRITTDTVADHREDVLASARKFIYPLQHTRKHVVRNSAIIFGVVLLAFFVYVSFSLYKLQSTSGFMHGVTRIVPFPVAKVGDSWVSYESYLFELRRNMHYYRVQQQTDFSNKSGKDQLVLLKKQAMDQVVNDVYVKKLAKEHGVSVSSKDVDQQVEMVRQENRLGSSVKVFDDVLKQFWGWNRSDFKRELKQQMLQQAVVAKLDTQTVKKADDARKQLEQGVDFATLAKQASQDPNTAPNGGNYPEPITPSSRDVAPIVTAKLFKLQAGQITPVINTGYTLEIVKALEVSKGSVKASHIQFNFRPIADFIKPLRKQLPPRPFIKI